MFYSLRTRIGLLYTLLIILVLAGIAIYVTDFVEQSYLDGLAGRLESEARLAGQIVLPIMLSTDDPDQIDAVAKKISKDTGSRTTIIAADGEVLGESAEDKESMENHANRPEIVQARLTGKGSERRTSATLGYDMYYVAVRIENGSQLLGYARMGVSLQLLEEKISTAAKDFAWCNHSSHAHYLITCYMDLRSDHFFTAGAQPSSCSDC